MRPYEKLKTIYEIASRMIVRGEGAWKDYLSFAARIHKYSFDNTAYERFRSYIVRKWLVIKNHFEKTTHNLFYSKKKGRLK